MNTRLLLALATVFFACVLAPVRAAEIPLMYNKSQLAVIRKNLPQNPEQLPWQKQSAQEDTRLVFDVEVRDGRSLYNQQGWFNLSSYEERSGVLLAFPSPTQSPIVPSKQYAAVDILLIDYQGSIRQIVPNIMLAELEQNLVPPTPVLAFLFLKAGTCEKLSISPGDTVEYSIFHKPPVVLSAPGVPQPAAPTAPVAPIVVSPEAPVMQRTETQEQMRSRVKKMPVKPSTKEEQQRIFKKLFEEPPTGN